MAAEQPGVALAAPAVSLEKTENGLRVSIEVRRSGKPTPWGGLVTYTGEPLTMTGAVGASGIEEANLLGSGIAYDLDGDGATTSTFAARCEGEKLQLDGLGTLSPTMTFGEVATWDYHDESYGFRGRRLGEKGVHAMLYGPCSGESVTIGFSEAALVPTVLPGPVLSVQMLVAATPLAEPKFKVKKTARGGAGIEPQAFGMSLYEQLDDKPAWYVGRGLMIPLDATAETQTVVVEVEGTVEFAIVAINEGGGTIQRARSHNHVHPIR